MVLLRILFVLGFLSPGYFAMEIQPPILPRNLDVYCKVCEGIHTIFDSFSYEDYDFWRTIDIQDKLRFFCSFCKKKPESTTLPTTTTSSETSLPASTSTTRQSETPETTAPTTTPSEPVTTTSTPVTTSSEPVTTTSTPVTTS